MKGSSQNKIGEVDDVLIDNSGKITAFIVGVGGFLGVGQKDVALPFDAVKGEKNGKWWLTVNESKDALKRAKGFTYDKTTTAWVAGSK